MGVFLWPGDQALNSPLSGWWQITETTSGEPLRLQLGEVRTLNVIETIKQILTGTSIMDELDGGDMWTTTRLEKALLVYSRMVLPRFLRT